MASGPKGDWIDSLDFGRALANCHADFLGDWYRDPWGWVEVDWILEEGKLEELVKPRLKAEGVSRVSRLDVAKENFGVRPAVVMDPIDRLCYQSLVDRLSPRLSKTLRPWVCGWRLPTKAAKSGHYARQDKEWERYRLQLRTLAGWSKAALRTDIVSCFASIAIDTLAEDVLDTGSSAVSKRLVEMLRGFDAVHGRSGLAQRSAASALLANFYLTPLDDLLETYAPTKGLIRLLSPTRVLRWMDDIWVFGSSPGEMRKIQVELSEAMRAIGLNMNISKTDVLEGDAVYTEAMKIEHSGVDSALGDTPMDKIPLEALVEALLEKPEQADRTSVRFATKRMRDHKLYDQVPAFVERAPRMPQSADHVARLFRDSGVTSDLEDWYVEFCRTDWATIDWSVAQMGTMFPSKSTPSGDGLKDFFAEQLVESPSLAMTSLAAERLTSWDHDLARQAIRDATDRADNPQIRRALALASVSVGEKRATVRKLLGEFEENAVTLQLLEETSFKKPRVEPDFSGG